MVSPVFKIDFDHYLSVVNFLCVLFYVWFPLFFCTKWNVSANRGQYCSTKALSLDGFTGLLFWYLRYLEMIDGPSEDEMSLSSFIHRKTKQRDIKSPQQMILKICW